MGTLAYTFAWESFNEVCTDIIGTLKSYGVKLIIKYSVQFSCSVMSDSLRPHELQHARPPCPSPTPRVLPNPCPLSR